MLPLRDNLPTARFPILTVLLVVINVGVFVWQVTLPTEEASTPELAAANISESDEATIELGAIPYRLAHPGEGDCSVVYPSNGGQRGDIACSPDQVREAENKLLGRGLTPEDAPLEEAAWWITIFTSMFMHGGILHLAGNMLFLWVFGNNVEDSMGRPRFILFYLLAGIVAVYAQTALSPDATVPTIGASGAVAGVLGAYALLHPRARVLTLVFIIFFITFVEIPAFVLLGVWFLLQFLPVVGQLGTPEVAGESGGVAYLAHVGGFVFGLALIKLFVKRDSEAPRLPRPAH